MSKLPLAARLYVIGLIAAAGALLAGFGALPTWRELPVFGGLAYALLGGTIAPLGWPQSATAIVGAVCSYFVVNSGAIALAVGLSTYQPARRVWQQNFLWGAPSYFMGAGVSALIAEAAARQL